MAKVYKKFAIREADANRYLNEGGLLLQQDRDVIVFNKRVRPTAQPINYVQIQEWLLEYGSFEQGYYFRVVEQDETDPNLRIIAVDNLANIKNQQSSKLLSKDGYQQLAERLSKAAKRKQLFYCSFDAKTLVENFILKWVKLTNE